MIDSGPGRKYYDHCPHTAGDHAICDACGLMRSRYRDQTLKVLHEQMCVAHSALHDIQNENYDGTEDARSVAGIACRAIDEIAANKSTLFPIEGE